MFVFVRVLYSMIVLFVLSPTLSVQLEIASDPIVNNNLTGQQQKFVYQVDNHEKQNTNSSKPILATQHQEHEALRLSESLAHLDIDSDFQFIGSPSKFKFESPEVELFHNDTQTKLKRLETNKKKNANGNNQKQAVKSNNKLKLFMNNRIQSKKISLASFIPRGKTKTRDVASTTRKPRDLIDSDEYLEPMNSNINYPPTEFESLIQNPLSQNHNMLPYPIVEPTLLAPHLHGSTQMHMRGYQPNQNLFPFGQIQANNQLFAQNHLMAHSNQLPISPRIPDKLDQMAAQTSEHFERIRMTKHPNEMPMYFASSIPNGNLSITPQQFAISSNNNLNTVSSNYNNNSNNNISNNNNQQLDTLREASALSQAAAATLLTERAKTLLSHINLGNKPALNAVASGLPRNNRDTSTINSIGSQQTSQSVATNNLSDILKNAAEAWASSNINAGTMPAIMVENDGPTITTLDFNNNLGRYQQPIEREPEDENETTFYSEENEDSQSEGSNEAKRLVKMRQSHRHPFANQADASLNEFYEAPGHLDGFEGTRIYRQSYRPENVLAKTYQSGRFNQQPQQPRNNYPDSINAIKEHNLGTDANGNSKNLASDLGKKIANSNQDQIDQLIKELKTINKKKKDRDEGDLKIGSDDYDDLLNKDDDDDDDEQTKMLRKKLLSRLKAKGTRKRAHSKNSDATSESAYNKDAIKIPLHALLLAALDRRMSPSEQSSQTLVDQLMDDQRNKQTLLMAQRDFNDVTSDLDPLLNSSQILDSLSTTQSPAVTNLVSLNFVDQRNVSDQMNPISAKDSDNESSFKGRSDYEDSRDIDERENHSRPDDAEIHTYERKKDHQKGLDTMQYQPVDDHEAQIDSITSNSMSVSPQRTRKGRRDVSKDDSDGDFDVEQEIQKYSSDKNEQSLEPKWINDRKKRPEPSNQRGASAVEFDDDYDEMAKSTRHKILKRRRRPPEAEEDAYEAKEQKFFDTIQKDTDKKIDIDKDIEKIADSDEPERSDERNDDKRAKKRRKRKRPEREDDEDAESDYRGGGDGDYPSSSESLD